MASLFQRIFRRQKPPADNLTHAEVISGGGGTFTAWGGDAYANDIYRGAVDAIARNAAKLKGSHVVKYQDKIQCTGDCRLNRILQVQPNPYMSAFDMLYKLITQYYQFNNAFAYLQWDDRDNLAGIYPLTPLRMQFESDSAGSLYCHFYFHRGKEVILPYGDVIHLRRNFNGDDLLGDNNAALFPALQLAHTQNEGIQNSIKSSARIRGIIKWAGASSREKMKDLQEQFVKDHLDISNNGGVAVMDQKSEYIPLNNSPVPIDEGQLKAVKAKIHDYLGISEQIVNSTYTEDDWAAFYESTIEPLAVQMSLEFTRKIFTEREQAFGNSIMFDSGRLQFSSNKIKIALIKELAPMRLLTINEGREILNLPAVPDGDVRLQSLNYMNAADVEQYQMGKAGLPPTGRQTNVIMEVQDNEGN